MKYTTLLIDADDTLFDFPACEYGALRQTLTDAGLAFNDEIYHSFSSINSDLWKKFELNQITRQELRVRRFSELLDRCFDALLPEKAPYLADHYVDCLSHQATLIDGTTDALHQLSQHCEIYIITNGLSKVQHGRLSLCDIPEYTKRVFISEEMGANKPSKLFFDKVLRAVPEKDTTKILVVGDSLTSDMQGGRNAGLDTCLYDRFDRVSLPHPLCDYKIGSLNELLPII